MKRKTSNLFFPFLLLLGPEFEIWDPRSEIRDGKNLDPPINIPDRQHWVPSIFFQTFCRVWFGSCEDICNEA